MAVDRTSLHNQEILLGPCLPKAAALTLEHFRKQLLGRYPWGLTAEEFAPVEGSDTEHRWLVDPIDGATNFIHGQHYT